MKKQMCALVFAVCFASLSAHAATEIRFSWWGGGDRHEATLAAIKAFEAANPDVVVKPEYMGWDGYLERLTTQIGSQSEPDLMQIDWAWLAMFSKDGNGYYNIYDLQDKVDFTKEYDKQWLDTGTVAGKLNAIPISFTASVMAYRRDMWEKAGVAYPKTWDEMFAAGKAFEKNIGPDNYPIDLTIEEITYQSHAYIFQKTGRQYLNPEKPEVALTREEIMDWLGWYKKMIENHVLVTPAERIAIAGNFLVGTPEMHEFISGQWAGSASWDASLVNLMNTVNPADYEIGPYPTVENAKSSGRVGRPAMLFAVSRNGEKQEAAARLAAFLLTTEEASKILGATRGIPLSKTGYAVAQREGLITPINQSALDQIRATQCYTPSPYFEHARTKNLLREIFEAVGYGTMTIEEGASRLIEEGNQIVQRLAR
jgi:oligogalacturonide transport system substrate-binding protein